jgi:hypothetical protein
MSLPVSQCLRFSVAALLAAAASATYAQTTKEGTLGSGKSTLDEIQRMVEDAHCRPSSAVKIRFGGTAGQAAARTVPESRRLC